jgi:hypothetical protein
MHGGGTSLVAGMLHAVGVAMNPNPRGWIHRKNYRTYEDSEFVRLNAAILHSVDGNWKKVPAREDLAALSDDLMGRMRRLIEDREERYTIWGFKDPRTALTVHLYHPELPDPRYVVVGRKAEDIARSLATRSTLTADPDEWLPLIETYHARIWQFVDDYEPRLLYTRYNALLSDEEEVKRLVEFAGVERDNAVEQAVGMIKKDEEPIENEGDCDDQETLEA